MDPNNPLREISINPDEIVIDILKEKMTTNSIETQLMLQENYDIYYGIIDHTQVEDRPFALVELHSAESFDRVNPLYELMDRFAEAGVLKYFGIPFDRFIEMPRDYTKALLEKSTKLSKIDAQTAENITNEFNALTESMNK